MLNFGTIQKVIYDLNTPGRDYEALYALFSRIDPRWCRVQDSFVLVQTQLDPLAIRTLLLLYAGDRNDDIFVEPLSDEWAANLRPEVREWLRQRGRLYLDYSWEAAVRHTQYEFEKLRLLTAG